MKKLLTTAAILICFIANSQCIKGDCVDGTGKIKYDLRMHEPDENTTGEEEYNTQHDHGTGFRAKFENIASFYDEVDKI